MSKLLRYHTNTDICFVTTVTHLRKPILVDHAELLLSTINKYCKTPSCDLLAYVILPDHLHCIIDGQGENLSKIMQRIKLSFSKKYRFRLGVDCGQVWQKRFWDHIIRNQRDMNRHIDYIHYNPVKHGLTDSPFKWKYSTIHRYYRNGYYDLDWGRKVTSFVGDFGE